MHARELRGLAQAAPSFVAEASEQELRLEAAAMLDRPDDAVAFIARDEHSKVVAFAEATMRHDYVNG